MLKFGMHTHLPLYTLFLTLRISDLEEFFFLLVDKISMEKSNMQQLDKSGQNNGTETLQCESQLVRFYF